MFTAFWFGVLTNVLLALAAFFALVMQDGPEPIHRVGAILAITGFRSALWRNQPLFFIQAQLTAGHVGSFAQGAGGLQSFESGDGDASKASSKMRQLS